MAFKKQFTCGCDVPNCNAETVVWATSELGALQKLIHRGWNIVSEFKNLPVYNYMYCPDHFNTKPSE